MTNKSLLRVLSAQQGFQWATITRVIEAPADSGAEGDVMTTTAFARAACAVALRLETVPKVNGTPHSKSERNELKL